MSSRTALVSPLCGGTESQAGKAAQTRWSSSRVTTPRPASAVSKPDKISISAAQVAKRPSTAAAQHRHHQQRQELGAGVAGPGRPMSARTQRPLSGNVYLKKTVKNGWVACSVHDEEEWGEEGEEGEEDEWEEDEVGCAWGSETLLDGLLRSKKLMNSKRVQHMDWTAGEVAIPTFHCQRCRDHWYGLTHYPCDEELARLIRQGLWTTGQGPVDRDLLLGGRGSLAARDRRHILKEGGARGGDKLNLPPIVDRTSSDSSLDGSRSGGGRSDGKKGRRITFNMRAEEFVYSREGEEAVTDGRGSSKGRAGQTGEREEPEGSAHQTGPGSSQSLSRNIGKSAREEAGSGERVPEGVSLDQKADHPRQGGPPSDMGGGIPKGQDRSKQTGSTSSHGDSSGRGSSMSNVDRHPSSGGASSEDISKFGEGYGRGGAHVDGGKMLSRGAEGGGGRKEGGGTLATGGSLAGSSTEDASGATVDSRSTMGAGGQGHHGDGGGSRWGRGSDSGEESGDEGGGIRTKPTTTNSDAGKNVRVQGAGFIARASSPTGSEWGDPTHALMFISNTACSSRAGSSLGGRVQSDELGKTQSDPVLLRAQPKLTAGDIVWGPPLTRAFTFSYHRQLPPTSQRTAANRSTTKPTKRRK